MGLDPHVKAWRHLSWLVLLAGCLCGTLGLAATDPMLAETALRDYLKKHPSLQNQRYEVIGLERLQRFPACPQPPDVSLLRRDRPWGKVNFKMTCSTSSTPWTRTFSLEVRVTGRYLTLKTGLPAGAVVQATDLEWAQGEISGLGLQGHWIEDAAQLVGQEAVRPLAAGSALRLNDFREPTVIKTGDLIKLSLVGQGFEMVTAGTAMGNAAIGATVRVKLPDGKILQGKAIAEGRVEAVLD